MSEVIITLILLSIVIIPVIITTYHFKEKHKVVIDDSHKTQITYKQFKTLVDSALSLRDFIRVVDNENLKDLVVKITFYNSLHGLTHLKIYIGTNEASSERLFKIKLLHGLSCKIYAINLMKSENNKVFQNTLDCIQGISDCYVSSILNDVNDD